eukprot:CAMPEP_0194527882 /NCGR_PEP_ID=MMETSP0253-20130528/64125_1 /TAXON_ID=2966 /ORGANISM="Noctiluca scintillans" /LENGTH=350 /DNA_ID=CAMNT_0039372879 /DNA_START=68 /DNA_END=1120 /DNA_ORIENTATION=-
MSGRPVHGVAVPLQEVLPPQRMHTTSTYWCHTGPPVADEASCHREGGASSCNDPKALDTRRLVLNHEQACFKSRTAWCADAEAVVPVCDVVNQNTDDSAHDNRSRLEWRSKFDQTLRRLTLDNDIDVKDAVIGETRNGLRCRLRDESLDSSQRGGSKEVRKERDSLPSVLSDAETTVSGTSDGHERHGSKEKKERGSLPSVLSDAEPVVSGTLDYHERHGSKEVKKERGSLPSVLSDAESTMPNSLDLNERRTSKEVRKKKGPLPSVLSGAEPMVSGSLRRTTGGIRKSWASASSHDRWLPPALGMVSRSRTAAAPRDTHSLPPRMSSGPSMTPGPTPRPRGKPENKWVP